ncbi:MAG: hypothetical protein HUN05_00405 [Desulfobacter sp.]|nr:MAG: hypothetical protein HUN05_00405 [Desulfobacter sp.]
MYLLIKEYIQNKNLNFIIAGGDCLNKPQSRLEKGKLDIYLDEFSKSNFSMISCAEQRLSPPFLAADINPVTGTARITFLIDLTQEALDQKASPFYSKIMGALSTQIFAARPDAKKIYFPFVLEDTVGRGLKRLPMDEGTALIQNRI